MGSLDGSSSSTESGRVGPRVAGAMLVLGVVLLIAVVTVRAAGWWPATHRHSVSAADAASSWPFPGSTAELVCRRHWGGRIATSIVAGGQQYALNGAAEEDGSKSTDELLSRYDRAQRTPFLLTLTELALETRQMCGR